MLKKITVTSALVLAVSLVALIVTTPFALGDSIKNGETIVRQFYNSSGVKSWPGSECDVVHIDIPYADILVEQSKDNDVYYRFEGFFADRIPIHAAVQEADGVRTLTLSQNDDELFYDTSNNSYLLRHELLFQSSRTLVLRIPARMSVTTQDRPYYVTFNNAVQFANREYYDNREWDQNYQPFEKDLESGQALEKLQARRGTMMTAFRSDLDMLTATVPLQSENKGPNFYMQADNEIDQLVNRHARRMEELFPVNTSVYDKETLTTLLKNYLSLVGELTKQSLRLENGHYTDSVQLENAQSNYERLNEKVSNAESDFSDSFISYMDSIASENALSASEPDPIPLDNTASSDVEHAALEPADSEPAEQPIDSPIASESESSLSASSMAG